MTGADGSSYAVQEFGRIAHAAEVPSVAAETQGLYSL